MGHAIAHLVIETEAVFGDGLVLFSCCLQKADGARLIMRHAVYPVLIFHTKLDLSASIALCSRPFEQFQAFLSIFANAVATDVRHAQSTLRTCIAHIG